MFRMNRLLSLLLALPWHAAADVYTEPGFYLYTMRLPERATTGFWRASLNVKQYSSDRTDAQNDPIHMGWVLKGNGEDSGFFAFPARAGEVFRLTARDYTQQLSKVNLSLVKRESLYQEGTSEEVSETIVGPVEIPVEQPFTTPALTGGSYVLEIRSPANAPRTHFGVTLENFGFRSLHFGGWLDNAGEGFLAFSLKQEAWVSLSVTSAENDASHSTEEIEWTLSRQLADNRFEPIWPPHQNYTFQRISAGPNGQQWPLLSQNPEISADGRRVAFLSYHHMDDPDALPSSSNTHPGIYLWEDGATRELENVSAELLTRQDLALAGDYLAYVLHNPCIKCDGNYLLRIYSLITGEPTRVTSLHHPSISLTANGEYLWYLNSPHILSYFFEFMRYRAKDAQTQAFQPIGVHNEPILIEAKKARISGNGQYAVFTANDTKLDAQDTDRATDVYYYDFSTGKARILRPTTESAIFAYSETPTISADGRFVAYRRTSFLYESSRSAVILHDMEKEEVYRVESGVNPVLSGDGRFLLVTKFGEQYGDHPMKPKDPFFEQIVLYRVAEIAESFLPPTGFPITVNPHGEWGNGNSEHPAISHDGRYVVFSSFADNLVEGDTNGTMDVFLLDRGVE